MPQPAEVERISEAVGRADPAILDEYGGLNGAMRRLVWLKEEQEERRGKEKRELAGKHRGEWRELYRRQEGERSRQAEDCGSLRGRVKQWREQGRRWWELAGAIRGKSEVVEGWIRSLEQSHREQRAGLGREQGRELRESGVFRLQRPGYREERFEAIGRMREYVAGMSTPDPGSGSWGNAIRLESARKKQVELDKLIRSLLEGDRKELDRRDREHPPPVIPQQKPAESPEQSWDYGPSR